MSTNDDISDRNFEPLADEQARTLDEWARNAGINDGGTGNGPTTTAAAGAEGDDKRPLIKIPADKRELIDFCRDCGRELGKENRLFRRDRIVVAINQEKARLDVMTPRTGRVSRVIGVGTGIGPGYYPYGYYGGPSYYGYHGHRVYYHHHHHHYYHTY